MTIVNDNAENGRRNWISRQCITQTDVLNKEVLTDRRFIDLNVGRLEMVNPADLDHVVGDLF